MCLCVCPSAIIPDKQPELATKGGGFSKELRDANGKVDTGK